MNTTSPTLQDDIIPFVPPTQPVAKPTQSHYQPEPRKKDAASEPFTRQDECEALLLQMLHSNPPEGAHEWRIFDPNLALLASKPMSEALQEFFLASRAHRLIAVLLDDQPMRRDYHRLMHVLKTFAHVCEIYVLQRMRESVDEAFVLGDKHHLLLRPNRERYVGTLYRQQEEIVTPYRERFEELLEASERVGIHTLGL